MKNIPNQGNDEDLTEWTKSKLKKTRKAIKYMGADKDGQTLLKAINEELKKRKQEGEKHGNQRSK